MYKDSLGFGMAICVYTIMFLGNSIFFYIVVFPHLKDKDEYMINDEAEGAIVQEAADNEK